MPGKLMLVRNEDKAEEIQSVIGDEWLVKGFRNVPLGSRAFDVIMIVDQPIGVGCSFTEDKWVDFIVFLKTKLSANGKLVEVY